MSVTLTGTTALVTGANGGLGREFVRQLLDRGAVRVYAATRRPVAWDDSRIVPLLLDVTDADSVSRAAATASDVDLVISNAGVGSGTRFASGDLDDIRSVFETNFFGAIAVASAFAPVLERRGGGAILSVHSALSWLATGAYSASKAALWSATNSLRVELAPQGTHVLGLHLGYTDTPMIADLDVPKGRADDVVREALDGLERGDHEVLADDTSRQVKAALAAPVEALYPQLRAV